MTVVSFIAAALPVALGIAMIGAGGVNLAGPASVRESFTRWGYPKGFHRVTGGLEVVLGLLLLVPATSRVGAVCSALVLLAAMITLIRHRDWGHMPAAVLLTVGIVAAIAIHGPWAS